ncbi:MAG: ribonuclease P protein subunit [Theionarchaea archaeon]|nr:ribonuclease P protein subunit [Theionarchaea archaeon]MBU7001778.1 ribonuclease P protein subunit [Theionarchaea archaeon]MBU7022273.1 ribonuclease P protein subunit [Theionarchaea archaeon]MBU7035507.1 ribonuclease P protein subunit [Theionarchaea archaeon]MBU7041146.1 ribonuclease P protein subunit [Theionarchaea archaeon]
MTYRTLIIGKELEVIFSTNPADLHSRGTVVDETQNMIQIENGKLKWLIKKNVVVLLDGRTVDGRELIGRPEDRMKR